MSLNRTVLYTTIYPGIDRFLSDWCFSLKNQDNQSFDVLIGVDGIAPETALSMINLDFPVNFIWAVSEDTPISLRNRAIMSALDAYDVIIFTDSDDILEPTRVSASLHGLEDADIYGCALKLIDEHGADLGVYFGLEDGEGPETVLPTNNYLGLSNTAWRTDVLQRCLPAPESCVAMDWFLVTKAWGSNAKIFFDKSVRMGYRQYGANTACVLPPFSSEQILKATDVVSRHYLLILSGDLEFTPNKLKLLENASSRVEKFRNTITSSREVLDAYVSSLNQLPPHRLWWQSVANPTLEEIWNY